jgi:retron-type reverse transcriptase
MLLSKGLSGLPCTAPSSLEVTTPERDFSQHSYGFISGRSQHQAVQMAQHIVSSGKPYVVDIDLSKFFDRIHHDRLIARMGEKVSDKRILRLVGIMLRSGVMT